MGTENFDSQQKTTVACCSGSDFIYFDSLDSLFKWDGQTMDTRADDIVRMRNFRWKNDRPKTLLCHDHRGGFLQYESKNGIDLCANTADPSYVPIYSFFHWWYIDVFVYFSHHFITVPPPVWTNQAHSHGVLMLGTFITEANELCSQIFSNKRTIDQLVSRMTHLCKEYHFDGWLINIENIIEPGNLDNIEYFLSKLREILRIEVHNCTQVIWYDSVTDRGELKWQNELNQCNRRWFNAVDGFYTNYAWNEQHIHRTLKTLTGMTPERSPFDIYVGIDVFGRGCLGGGGWNCAEPMEILRRYGMSAAIFAPGWICEKFPGSQRILFENSFLFWNSLKPYLFLHKMRERKLCTNFSIGFSSDCELGSFECREEDRFCMLNASVQPFYLGSPGFAKDLEPGLIINGGGLHDLFVCDISIQELDRHLEVRYCSSARIGIAVTISNGRNVLHLYNSTAFEESEDKPDAKARATCSEEAGGIKNLVEETPAECSLQPQIQKGSLIEEEREKIPFEERVKQFKELLKEVGITSTSKWEDEQQNLVFDHRYLLLSAAERKATFYAYCLERQSETKKMDERKVDDEKGENEKTVILDLKEEATVVTVMKKSVEETCHFSLKDRADWRIEKVQLWTPPDTKNLRVYHFEMCLK